MTYSYCTTFVFSNIFPNMNIKKHIPNLFTFLNLFSGCVALVFVSQTNYLIAFLWVALGIFFDFFDGFFARKFQVAGPLGVQLDSLADMVTSGVVPGYVVFQILSGMQNQATTFGPDFSSNTTSWIPYLGFLITLGACYRLAKFNIDTRQADSFIGLPTPANSLFFTSLPIVMTDGVIPQVSELLHQNGSWIILSVLSAYVMNAEIPLFSLKIKEFSWAKYTTQLIFLLLSVVLIFFFRVSAVPVIILMYVLISIIRNLFTKKTA